MMVAKSILSLYFLLFIPLGISAQNYGCNVINRAFNAGERVTYQAVYNWGFIWLRAGDVVFTVKDTQINNTSAYHFKALGWSLKEYDWFYKVRDRFESIVEKQSFEPVWFERDTYEGGFKTYNQYIYDHSSNQIKITSFTSKRIYKQETLPLTKCTFDVLSAIYYCRNIEFDSLSVGDKVPLPMVVDNEIFNLYIRYLGREQIELHDGRVFNSIKFSALLVEGTIFKGGEDLIVWVTDDENRVPILIEAKILVGSVKAELKTTEGLRH